MKRISRKVSEETKQKMSQAKIGSRNPRYHQNVSEETRKRISEGLKRYWENIPY
ncbi:MAG: hypothetical protein LBB85_08000 [Dysgonamonadaceae bacterium]|jgi:hypothetical protein|nr:hypothetical protein [Dysgonamonadaceae bacterium]